MRGSRTVEPADCATHWGGDGLEVLSTPAILGNTERICADAMRPHLAPGEVTVGFSVQINHRAPAALGAKVEYSVAADVVGGKTVFRFEVIDDKGVVLCDGTHVRAVVNLEDFRRRVNPS
jgi:fluoroacetyl-CoA thioesterase